ncbi:MAG: hypothetical protein AB7W16_28950 [Candidatus Obscuribacterales bacterium]
MISVETSDELVREQVFADVLELGDIIDQSKDLNKVRDQIRALVDKLEYLLIYEG